MGVKDKGLWERIQYRYVYMGTVEREGKLYKKYEKIARFKNPRRLVSIISIILLLLVVSTLIIYLMRMGSQALFSGSE